MHYLSKCIIIPVNVVVVFWGGVEKVDVANYMQYKLYNLSYSV